MIKNTIDYYSVLNIAKINYLSQIHKHLIQKKMIKSQNNHFTILTVEKQVLARNVKYIH